jgi:hypothetical protein
VRWAGLQRPRASPQQFADQQPQQQQQGAADIGGLLDAATAQSWSDFSVRVALERLYRVNLGSLWEGAPAGAPGPAPVLPAYLAVSLEEKPPAFKERTPDFYANVGDAIRTLRDDVPLLFERELNCEWRRRTASSGGASLPAPARGAPGTPLEPPAGAARQARGPALTAAAPAAPSPGPQTRSTRRTSSSRTRATASGA